MLPAVRPATLLWTTVAVASGLTALSAWVRLLIVYSDEPLDEHAYPPPLRTVAHRLLSADGEGNVPAWFSTGLLGMIALVSLGIAVALRARHAADHRHWAGLAAVFAFLSLDELAGIHEELIPALGRVMETDGVLTFPWVLVAAPLVVVFAVVYAPFLRRLPRRTAGLLLLAGGLYVGGALALEMVSGTVFEENRGWNGPYVLVTSAEELLEMLGAAVCLYAVADFAARLGLSPGARADDRAPDGGRNTANGSVTSSSEEAKR